MVDRRTLSSGRLLAQRYELQDLVAEKYGSSTWRAADQTLTRSVGIQIIPSADNRSHAFAEAARASTVVTDPRFLRILDVVEDENGLTYIVREWARGFSLDHLLLQSPLPNRRAATIVSEVAEAMSHAHEHGVYHRFLTPHSVLVKQTGAVRLTGLSVTAALANASQSGTPHEYEQADVEALGKLLYATLSSRWPGARTDGLRATPTLHGRLLRPRQVRAGVSRDVDTVCDRILGTPPRHDQLPLRSAHDIANILRLAGEDDSHLVDAHSSLLGSSSPDLLRLDPVVLPDGPPPGINPPRRLPKAFAPRPPTTYQKGKARAKRYTRGDRLLIALGLVLVIALVSALAFLVGRASSGPEREAPTSATTVGELPIRTAADFDPLGDGEERADLVPLAVDDDDETGWRTASYFNNPSFGGFKDGVGLLIDIGSVREVEAVEIGLRGSPTDLDVYAAAPEAGAPPESVDDMTRVASIRGGSDDVRLATGDGVISRFLVVWFTKLPAIETDTYRGEITDLTVIGRS